MSEKSLREKVREFNDSLPIYARRKNVEVDVWVSDQTGLTSVMASYRIDDRTVKTAIRSIPNEVAENDPCLYFTLRCMTRGVVDDILAYRKQKQIEEGKYYEYDYGRG